VPTVAQRVGAEAEVEMMTVDTHVVTETARTKTAVEMVITTAEAVERVRALEVQIDITGLAVSAAIAKNQKPREDRRPGRNEGRRASRSPKREATPPLTEDERDRRTVFVQQLAARLRTKELIAFFEKVGPVKEAQIVKDRVSGRSKGYVQKSSTQISGTDNIYSVGYVEFKNEESVPAAIQLTGQKLLGIPIIAQHTEAEKNRQVRNPEAVGNNPNSIPFHRLYVGNIHFSITESDLQNVFEPFGELEFVQLQKEEQGRSRGYGFVQYVLSVHSYIAARANLHAGFVIQIKLAKRWRR
jgi:CC1-like splicing factor